MNNKVKDLLKSIVISIGMALTIFSFVCVVFDIGYGGNFSLEGYKMTKLVIGCIIWFCFMRFYRREAREMNDKIQQMK